MDTQKIGLVSYATKAAAIPRERITWPDESSQPQNFSLPSSIIYYISKNPSNPTVYLKLAQSCKCFFEKLPILVAKDIYNEEKDFKICPKGIVKCDTKCCITINLKNIKSVIWVINEIYVVEKNLPNFFSLLSLRLYRSEACLLEIHFQEVLFDDYIIMASSVKDIYFGSSKMIYSDGSDVTLDDILAALPNIEKCDIDCIPSMFGSTTLKNIAKLKNLSNLHELNLRYIPEIKETEDFLTMLKRIKAAKIRLYFSENISGRFKNQLNAIIDNVIKDKTLKCFVFYNDQDREKLKIMGEQYYGNGL